MTDVRSGWALALAVVGMVGAAAPAYAGWDAPVDLSAQGDLAQMPQVAVDPHGAATVVWSNDIGTDPYSVVMAAQRPGPGSAWSAPVALTPRGLLGLEPQVAVAGNGDATAVWVLNGNGASIIQAAFKPAHRAWQQPVALSPPGQAGVQPALGVDAHGDAVVVWAGSPATNRSAIFAASRPAGARRWRRAVRISAPANDFYFPAIAVAGGGRAVAVWLDIGSDPAVVHAARLPHTTARWERPARLGLQHNPRIDTVARTLPRVAIDGRGDAVAVWQTPGNTIASASRAWRSRRWPPAVTISGQGAGFPDVAMTPRGDASAVWEQAGGGYSLVMSARRPAGSATWQAPVAVSTGGASGIDPHVAVDREGNALAVWIRAAFQEDQSLLLASDDGYVIQGARFDAAGNAWAPPTDLCPRGQNAGNARMALNARGDGVAIWQRPRGENAGTAVQAASYR